MSETSSLDAPEIQSDNTDLFRNADPNETFDDLDYESEASKKIGEKFKDKFKDRIKKAEGKKEEKEEKEEKAPKKEEKKKSEIDTLSDKEETEEKEKPKKAEKKKEDEEEEDSEEEVSEEEEKSLDAEKKGKLKIRMADGLYGIDPDAKVRVKIDGEFQEIPIQEAINSYSGKVAWDKKFTELGQQKKEFESQRTQVVQTQEFLKKTVGEIVGILNDQNKNPMDALQFLVEKSGQDPYTLWRRTLEQSLDEVEKLQSMDEHERKAYFLEKKDEFRTKADEARKKAYDEEMSRNTAIQKVDALRQAHGVSEEQFMESWDELEAQGAKNPTDEQIVEYASIKPHLNSVQDVLEAYEEFIDDSQYSRVVTDFAKQLRANEITVEQLKEIAANEFMDEDLKDLTVRKKAATKTKEPAKREETPTGKKGYESLDDYLDD